MADKSTTPLQSHHHLVATAAVAPHLTPLSAQQQDIPDLPHQVIKILPKEHDKQDNSDDVVPQKQHGGNDTVMVNEDKKSPQSASLSMLVSPATTAPSSSLVGSITVPAWSPTTTDVLPMHSIINVLMDIKKAGVLSRKLNSVLVYICSTGAMHLEIWKWVCHPWLLTITNSINNNNITQDAYIIAQWNHHAAQLCKQHAGKNHLVYKPVVGMEQHVDDKTLSKSEIIAFLDRLQSEGNLCVVFKDRLVRLLDQRQEVPPTSSLGDMEYTIKCLVEREVCHYWTRWAKWKNVADLIDEIHFNAAAILSKYESSHSKQ